MIDQRLVRKDDGKCRLRTVQQGGLVPNITQGNQQAPQGSCPPPTPVAALPQIIPTLPMGCITLCAGPTTQTVVGNVTVVSGPATQTITGSFSAAAVQTVAPTGTQTVAQGSTWTVAVGPATQTITGSFSAAATQTVAQGSTWTVAVGPVTQTVTGSFSAAAVQTIAPTGTQSVTQGSTWTVAVGPATQTVTGSFSAVATQTVAASTGTQTIIGSVTVAAFPATQTVTSPVTQTVAASTGTQTIIGAVTVAAFSATQTVSGITATGVAFASNPIIIGGVDTSNTVRPFVTTASGQQIVIGTITVGPATQTVIGSITTAPSGTQTVVQGSSWTVGTGPATQTIAVSTGTQTVIGSVTVAAFPATQTITGPTTQTVAASTGTQTVIGLVTVAAFPTTQTVTAATGFFASTQTVAVSTGTQTIIGSVTVAAFPATQTVTATGTQTVVGGDSTGTVNFTTTGGITAVTTNGGGTFAFNLSLAAGTLTTTSFQTEGSVDGSNWVSVPYAQMLGPSSGGSNVGWPVITSTVTSLVTPLTFVCSADGFKQMRLNVITLTIAATTTLQVRYTYQQMPYVVRDPQMATPAFVNVATSSTTTAIPAPSAGLSVYVTALCGTNADTAAVQATFTVNGSTATTNQYVFFMAAQGGGFVKNFSPPWKLPAATPLMVKLGGNIQSYFSSEFYIAP